MKRSRVLYLEVAQQIKEDIFSGKYPVGSMLPTENELEEIFAVSKITIRKAIELLAADEYVEKKSGKGTTVLSDRPYNKLSKAVGFTQILEKAQLDLEKKVIAVRMVQLAQTDPLFAYFGGEAVYFQRLYTLNGQPYIFFKHYLPATLKGLTKRDFEQESLYRIMNSKGYDIERFKDEFKAIILEEEVQRQLQTEEIVALKRVRRSVDYDQQVVEYSEAFYNTAQHTYQIEYET